MARIEMSPRRIRIVAAVVLVITFVLGAVAGASIWYFGVVSQERCHHKGGFPHAQELALSDTQQKAFDDILKKYRPELDEIMAASYPKIREVKERMDAELRALLSPQQQIKFDEMIEHHPPPGFPRPHGRHPSSSSSSKQQ